MTHNYNELYDTSDAEMLQDADNAITECNLWDWMKTYEPEVGKGFTFSSHENIAKINKAMKYEGHSGTSYAWTMRNMEHIAKNGWTTFYNDRIKSIQKRVDQIARRTAKITPLEVAQVYKNVLPDGDQQYDAMKKFSEGKMSYAEMRGLCG
jgi:hypothetical protein